MASGQHYRGKIVMERHIRIQVEDTPSNIPPPTSIHQPTCDLCHQRIGGNPIVPTTTGDLVHITCADRDALVASRQRQRQALIYDAGVLLVGFLIVWFFHAVLGLLLFVIVAVLHVRMNNV
jgi:hypothetical protein